MRPPADGALAVAPGAARHARRRLRVRVRRRRPARPAPSPATPPTPTRTAYDAALSDPREDSVYPDVGDPGVDALHYDLDLTWDPAARAADRPPRPLLLRATRTATTSSSTSARQLAGRPRLARRRRRGVPAPGKDLVVRRAGQGRQPARPPADLRRHARSRSPRPPTAPTSPPPAGRRAATAASGRCRSRTARTRWYAVNDQPSDKAFYDITIHAPKGHGRGRQRRAPRRATTTGGQTVTRWHLPEPAASYLITIAIGRLHPDQGHRPARPADQLLDADATGRRSCARPALRAAADGLPRAKRRPLPVPDARRARRPVEQRDGDPVDGHARRRTSYTLSRDVLVHEIAHQWYGDEVTPDDWSDLWMNEGMATYLAEANWTADHGPRPSRRSCGGGATWRRRHARRVRPAGRLPARRPSPRATPTTSRP